MPQTVYFETADLERVTAILNRRAAFMVKDITNIGRHHADEYAMVQRTIKRNKPESYQYLRSRGKRAHLRRWHATASQQVRMIEWWAYRFYLDFFGPW